ncbi:DotH/IcmK family type IV secretion protein [Methylobacterium sp. NEAU 140]|uniref:DotH/IcmK family type IV secretion protein n=1 Tax=Methylobacterium sp. NEAU 140 TaxID=3064945 RepID=UPI0027333A32|nr:DotH/IcmK family type IV secretion protein [Methylobacterium sp. NEAU 140]MDP4025772.1 DotH/IcmK family type IV secretion protein [Methylobacterium sp. NEAU 140]
MTAGSTTVRVWASGCLLAAAMWASPAALAQDATPGSEPAGGASVRRPAGVPPTGASPVGAPASTTAPSPTPRPLTPAELEELRQRMLGGTKGVMLKPGEISDIRRSVQDAQGAGTFPGRDGRMPRPEPRLLNVTQEISRAAPETLHLAYGVVSPITFVDGKGNPWPIASVAYDPRLFAQDGTGCGQDTGMGATQVAAAAGADRPSSINLMPCRYDTWGNILIRLEAVAYPIPLMILSGSSETVDIPVTVRVAGTSPLTPVKVASAGPAPARKGGGRPAGPPPGAPDTTALLHLFGAGTPPAGAQMLAANGAQAWLYRDRMYVRVQGNLVSPQPVASAEAGSGYRVYEFLRPVSRLVAEQGDGAETAITVAF